MAKEKRENCLEAMEWMSHFGILTSDAAAVAIVMIILQLFEIMRSPIHKVDNHVGSKLQHGILKR